MTYIIFIHQRRVVINSSALFLARSEDIAALIVPISTAIKEKIAPPPNIYKFGRK